MSKKEKFFLAGSGIKQAEQQARYDQVVQFIEERFDGKRPRLAKDFAASLSAEDFRDDVTLSNAYQRFDGTFSKSGRPSGVSSWENLLG